MQYIGFLSSRLAAIFRNQVFYENLIAWCGAATGLGLIALISLITGQALLMAPLGASAVLAFSVPDSPLSQPQNILGGHFFSAVIGISALALLGDGWWVGALAVATAIVVMQVTRTTHPPAGANPLIIHALDANWFYALCPVLVSACLLAFLAVFFNGMIPSRDYPKH